MVLGFGGGGVAATMWGGSEVAPAPNEITGLPAALRAAARMVTAMVAESEIYARRRAMPSRMLMEGVVIPWRLPDSAAPHPRSHRHLGSATRPRPVTPTVLLMRHAKADRPPGVADRDRPLAENGRHDAASIGAVLAKLRPAPSLVATSPARRALETATVVAAAAGWAEPRVFPALYRGGVEDVLEVIGSVRSEVVLLGGPDPTWSATVEALSGASVKLATGAVVAIELPGHSNMEGTGSLVWMLTPQLIAGRTPR
jgi:phosphohistidine phosphatase